MRYGSAQFHDQDAGKVTLFTRPTLAAISPARAESAKTAFSPRDASFPMRRSRIAQKLNVPKRTPRLFARCGLAERSLSILRDIQMALGIFMYAIPFVLIVEDELRPLASCRLRNGPGDTVFISPPDSVRRRRCSARDEIRPTLHVRRGISSCWALKLA